MSVSGTILDSSSPTKQFRDVLSSLADCGNMPLHSQQVLIMLKFQMKNLKVP